MIERILPREAVVHEATEDLDTPLSAAEHVAVARAVDKRRREFTTGRACARIALAKLGHPARSLPRGPRGEPLWPPGVVGSITHCAGYRASAVARASDLQTMGIDAEPHAPLPRGVLDTVAGEDERMAVEELARRRPEVCWDRLLFSAKEATYKAWFPLAGTLLGFEDVVVDLASGTPAFTASVVPTAPPSAAAAPRVVTCRWLVSPQLIVTAVAVPATRPTPTQSRHRDVDGTSGVRGPV